MFKALATIIAVIVLACVLGIAMAVWTTGNCTDRGGHIEIVWGGRSGWTCDGANR